MINSTAFGYEHENGTVQYILSHELTLDEIEQYLEQRRVPGNININKISPSIIEYFNKNSNELDNTKWRILYMLDGTVICRKWNSIGEFIYRFQ